MLNHSRTFSDLEGQECLPATGRSASRSRRVSARRRPRAACVARRFGRKGAQPLTALLQDVVIASCSDDGTTFAVLDLRDAGNRSHLALVTCHEFGDVGCLELLRGTALSLDPASPGMNLLPLAQQNKAVLQHLFDQLRSRYHRAKDEGLDATGTTESLMALVEQLISAR